MILHVTSLSVVLDEAIVQILAWSSLVRYEVYTRIKTTIICAEMIKILRCLRAIRASAIKKSEKYIMGGNNLDNSYQIQLGVTH